MLGLHLVSVTLHRWFTIRIELDNEEFVTLNAVFSVVWKVTI